MQSRGTRQCTSVPAVSAQWGTVTSFLFTNLRTVALLFLIRSNSAFGTSAVLLKVQSQEITFKIPEHLLGYNNFGLCASWIPLYSLRFYNWDGISELCPRYHDMFSGKIKRFQHIYTKLLFLSVANSVYVICPGVGQPMWNTAKAICSYQP